MRSLKNPLHSQISTRKFLLIFLITSSAIFLLCFLALKLHFKSINKSAIDICRLRKKNQFNSFSSLKKKLCQTLSIYSIATHRIYLFHLSSSRSYCFHLMAPVPIQLQLYNLPVDSLLCCCRTMQSQNNIAFNGKIMDPMSQNNATQKKKWILHKKPKKKKREKEMNQHVGLPLFCVRRESVAV